jgi:hypothetical protein
MALVVLEEGPSKDEGNGKATQALKNSPHIN